MHDGVLIQALLILAAVILVPHVERLKINAVIGYLAVGMAIGPYGFGVIHDPEGAIELAEIGIAFLLFTLGLELSIDRLKSMRRDIFGLGTAQVLGCAAAVAAGAWALGYPPATAMILGTALALSSTAVVIQMLSDQRELVTRFGRVAFAILLFQDIAVAPVLAMVPLVAEGGDLGPVVAAALVRAVVAVTAVVVVGRYLLPHLFNLASRTGRREVFVALVVFTALSTGFLTLHAGLSLALGAFLSGVVLAGSMYRHQIETDIEPFKGILLALFFMTIGMILDPQIIVTDAPAIGAVVVGLITVKAVIIAVLCRLFGIPLPMAIRLGLLLAAGGEFAFVIVGLALTNGLISTTTGQILIVSVAVTIALTPLLSVIGSRLQDRLEARATSKTDPMDQEAHGLFDHVVILGFGRVGRTIARLLTNLQVPYLALDMNQAVVAKYRAQGANVYYGNGDQIDVLRKAGLAAARLVVVTIDQPARVNRILSMLRHEYPDIDVIARAHDRAQAIELVEAGATRAVPETLEASLQLGRSILTTIGLPIEEIRQIIQRVREEGYQSVEPMAGDAAQPASAHPFSDFRPTHVQPDKANP